MSHSRHAFVFCILCVLLPVSQGLAQSQLSARVFVDGRAVDVTTGEPLAGARVLVNDGQVEASTDRDGTFRLIVVSPGSVTLKITYLGRLDWTPTLTVEPGAVVHQGDLAIGGTEENVLVVGTLIRDASARALNQGKSAPDITNVVSADQIGSFPDRSAAETTQRVAGAIRRASPSRSIRASRLGNAKRNSVRGPNYWTVDFALTKQVALMGQSRVQLRLEAFNLFNRVNYGPPNSIRSSAAFGTITSTYDPRQMQLGVKVLW